MLIYSATAKLEGSSTPVSGLYWRGAGVSGYNENELEDGFTEPPIEGHEGISDTTVNEEVTLDSSSEDEILNDDNVVDDSEDNNSLFDNVDLNF